MCIFMATVPDHCIFVYFGQLICFVCFFFLHSDKCLKLSKIVNKMDVLHIS